MALDFPTPSNTGEIHNENGYRFVWDGSKWQSQQASSAYNLQIVTGNTKAEVVDTGSDGHFKVTTEGTERLRIDSSGRLLVGATAAAIGSRMDVHGGSDGDNIFGVTGADQSSEFLALGITSSQAILSAGNASSNGTNLVLKTANSSGAENERMRIDSSGRLLLGTTSSSVAAATAVLQGNSSGIGASHLYLQCDQTTPVVNSDLGFVRFADGDGSVFAHIQGQVDKSSGAGDYPGRLVFSTTADGASSPTERMRIASSGRVGIGTTSPNVYGVHANDSSNSVYFKADSSAVSTAYGSASALSVGLLGTFTNHALAVYTNSAERMRIDSSGRLLVGTSSSNSKVQGFAAPLQVEGTSATTSSISITRNSNDGNPAYLNFGKSRGTSVGSNTSVVNGDNIGAITFNGSDGSGNFVPFAEIRCQADGVVGGGDGPGALRFLTTPDGSSSPTDRMRIKADGKVFVNNTSLNEEGMFNAYSNSSTPAFQATGGSSMGNSSAVAAFDKHANVNTTSQVFIKFRINDQNTGSGQINANGSSQAAFGSFSDRRLKENIVDLPSQLDNVCRLRPVEFDYIESEGGGHQTSFIAQEFAEVFPDAVGEREDGMKTLTGWGKTEAILVKALQEAVAKIEILEAKVAALEAE